MTEVFLAIICPFLLSNWRHNSMDWVPACDITPPLVWNLVTTWYILPLLRLKMETTWYILQLSGFKGGNYLRSIICTKVRLVLEGIQCKEPFQLVLYSTNSGSPGMTAQRTIYWFHMVHLVALRVYIQLLRWPAICCIQNKNEISLSHLTQIP